MTVEQRAVQGFAEHLQVAIDAGELFVVYVQGGPAGLRVGPEDTPTVGADDLSFTQAAGQYLVPLASISYVLVLA